MKLIQMPEPSGDLASKIDQLSGLLTVRQLISLVGMSRTTIYEYVTAKRIPYLRIGTMIRFDPHAIAEWLRQHNVAA
jgi:excisionase family DNA binding protein